jgi:hypothetical protein
MRLPEKCGINKSLFLLLYFTLRDLPRGVCPIISSRHETQRTASEADTRISTPRHFA